MSAGIHCPFPRVAAFSNLPESPCTMVVGSHSLRGAWRAEGSRKHASRPGHGRLSRIGRGLISWELHSHPVTPRPVRDPT